MASTVNRSQSNRAPLGCGGRCTLLNACYSELRLIRPIHSVKYKSKFPPADTPDDIKYSCFIPMFQWHLLFLKLHWFGSFGVYWNKKRRKDTIAAQCLKQVALISKIWRRKREVQWNVGVKGERESKQKQRSSTELFYSKLLSSIIALPPLLPPILLSTPLSCV